VGKGNGGDPLVFYPAEILKSSFKIWIIRWNSSPVQWRHSWRVWVDVLFCLTTRLLIDPDALKDEKMQGYSSGLPIVFAVSC
jgi:hypothetical protein